MCPIKSLHLLLRHQVFYGATPDHIVWLHGGVWGPPVCARGMSWVPAAPWAQDFMSPSPQLMPAHRSAALQALLSFPAALKPWLIFLSLGLEGSCPGQNTAEGCTRGEREITKLTVLLHKCTALGKKSLVKRGLRPVQHVWPSPSLMLGGPKAHASSTLCLLWLNRAHLRAGTASCPLTTQLQAQGCWSISVYFNVPEEPGCGSSGGWHAGFSSWANSIWEGRMYSKQPCATAVYSTGFLRCRWFDLYIFFPTQTLVSRLLGSAVL